MIVLWQRYLRYHQRHLEDRAFLLFVYQYFGCCFLRKLNRKEKEIIYRTTLSVRMNEELMICSLAMYTRTRVMAIEVEGFSLSKGDAWMFVHMRTTCYGWYKISHLRCYLYLTVMCVCNVTFLKSVNYVSMKIIKKCNI